MWCLCCCFLFWPHKKVEHVICSASIPQSLKAKETIWLLWSDLRVPRMASFIILWFHKTCSGRTEVIKLLSENPITSPLLIWPNLASHNCVGAMSNRKYTSVSKWLMSNCYDLQRDACECNYSNVSFSFSVCDPVLPTLWGYVTASSHGRNIFNCI